MKKIIFILFGISILNAQWQIIWQENFEQGLPQDWQVIDGNNDGYTWQVGNPGFYYPPPSYGTKYAYYNDDEAGPVSPPADETLISPPVFISNTDSLRFTYGYGFNTLYFDDVLEVKIRVFTQGSWTNYELIDTIYNMGNGIKIIDITEYLPCDSVQFMFHYSDGGGQNFGPGVDNLKLEGKSVFVAEIFYPINYPNKDVQIFDITGRKLKSFKKGIYFKRKGKNLKKIFILK